MRIFTHSLFIPTPKFGLRSRRFFRLKLLVQPVARLSTSAFSSRLSPHTPHRAPKADLPFLIPISSNTSPFLFLLKIMLPTLCFIPTIAHSQRSSFVTSSTTNRPHRLQSRSPCTVRMVTAPERLSTTDSDIPITMSVLLPEKLSDKGIALLTDKFIVSKKLNLTPETLIHEIPNHDAIIIRSGTKMTREVIDAATKLKVIGRAGVGVDNIDLQAATERGVLVVNAPTGNCVAAAEHTIALLCALARHVSPADAMIKSGGWNRSAYVGASLVDKTLGVIGLGRIGREVAKRARGLGFQIVASDPFTSEEAAAALGVQLMSFEEVLATSDFITLHLPLIPTTKNLIDADAISKMKDGARLINAARGGIVNEPALIEALDSGKIAGAALDCFASEPLNKHPDTVSAKLAKHPLVLATPHLGASTREAQLDVAVEIASAVRDALGGDMVPTTINAPSMPPALLHALKPRAALCEYLGRLAYFVSGQSTHGEVAVEYYIPDAGEDTRFLRAGLIKGLMEPALGLKVTIVNADHVAKNANLNLSETNHFSAQDFDNEVVIRIKDAPAIAGRVINGNPHVTRIGRFEVDLRLSGIIMAYSQDDRPGQLGRVGTLFGENGINISFMTLARDPKSAKALVMLGLDSRPSDELVYQIRDMIDDPELRPIVVEF